MNIEGGRERSLLALSDLDSSEPHFTHVEGASEPGGLQNRDTARCDTADVLHSRGISSTRRAAALQAADEGAWPSSSTNFSERSLEVRHSAWDRDDAGANPVAPTISFQVRSSISRAPRCDRGGFGANPDHLTIFTRLRTNSMVASLSKRRKRGQHASDAPFSGSSSVQKSGVLTSRRSPERSRPPRPFRAGVTATRRSLKPQFEGRILGPEPIFIPE